MIFISFGVNLKKNDITVQRQVVQVVSCNPAASVKTVKRHAVHVFTRGTA